MAGVSAHKGDVGSVQDENRILIRESIERLRSWINRYVQAHIGSHVSATDFTERIEIRLLKRLEPGTPKLNDIDEAVQNVLRLLVHESRRSDLRKSRRYTSNVEIETVQDPSSLHFASRVELDSQIQFIRKRIPEHLLPIIDTLYGFADAEELSIEELTEHFGIRRNTLNKKLSRLFRKLRRELRPSR